MLIGFLVPYVREGWVFQNSSWILSTGFSVPSIRDVWMFDFGFSGIAWILNRLGIGLVFRIRVGLVS